MHAEQAIDSVRLQFRRWLYPLVAWIPDITLFPRGRQAAIAAGASLLVHLLVLLFFIIGSMVLPEKKERTAAVPPRPAELQLVPMPPPPVPDQAAQRRREFLLAKGLDPNTEKPENAIFESDKDMLAASEKPPTGLAPLPGQEGRTDLPGVDFANQDVRIGLAPEPTSETIRPPDEQPEKRPQTLPPTVSPLYTPQPVAAQDLAAAEKAKPADNLPDPAKTAKATPPPLKMRDKPEDDAVAMLMATPVPRPIATPSQEHVPASAPPTPRPSITSRFQENMRKTGVDSSINNRGKAGVNAINTPMGRYNRRLSQQIESLWLLKQRGQVSEVGTVRVKVKLRADGTVQGAQVLDDGGSPHHTEICLQVIRDMRPEKMPPEADPLLEDGVMEITFSFTLF